MPRIVLSLAEWTSIAGELTGGHHVISPPGLQQRIQALLHQAPRGWPDQPFALELDESSCDAVVAAQDALLVRRDPHVRQRIASVAEAVAIIHDHQHHHPPH